MALEMSALPKWLNEDYIADLLQMDHMSKPHVKVLDVTQASAPGENYLGTLYRLTIDCNSSKKSLVVKLKANKNQESEFMINYGVFQKELDIYQCLLPKMYAAVRERLGPVEEFIPYCYPSTRTDAIILQDLRPLGYTMLDRRKLLDMEHSLLALSTLAKLHAFSYIAGPDNFRHLYDSYFSEETRHLSEGFVTSVCRCFSRSVSKWEGYEKYGPLLQHFSDSALDRYILAIEPKEGEFNVLNHGDGWTNNFLFRYSPDTGEVQDMKIIDFQLAHFSSPAIDLIYFLYSSPRLEVWRQQDELMKHYHDELTRWLKAAGLGEDVYTFQDLQKDLKEKLPFAIATICTVLAIAMATPGEGPDLDKMIHEKSDSQTSQYDRAHNTDKFKELVKEYLPHLEKEGLFSKLIK